MQDLVRQIPAFTTEGELNVIIETVQGSRNKYKYDEENRTFRLNKVLPVGLSFPFDFGFVPGTRAEDGDPLDVLLLMGEPCFPSCMVRARPVGVVKVLESGERNDRLIAVCPTDPFYSNVTELDQLPAQMLDDIESFFQTYPAERGQQVEVMGRDNAAVAVERIRKAEEAFAAAARSDSQ